MGIFSSSTNFVMDLFNVACIVGGGIIAITTEAFSTADYTAFVVSVSLFISPLTTLINFVEQYQDGVTGFKRFLDVMDEKVEYEKPNAIKNITLAGNIDFNHVFFNYETKDHILMMFHFLLKKVRPSPLLEHLVEEKQPFAILYLIFINRLQAQ